MRWPGKADDYAIEWLAPWAVITMPAEIDVTNSGAAREALVAAAGQGPAVLVVDMTETTFCDSAGVQALVAAYRHAETTGTRLRLVAPVVERILTLAGFDQLIPVYLTLESALADRTPAGR